MRKVFIAGLQTGTNIPGVPEFAGATTFSDMKFKGIQMWIDDGMLFMQTPVLRGKGQVATIPLPNVAFALCESDAPVTQLQPKSKKAVGVQLPDFQPAG